MYICQSQSPNLSLPPSSPCFEKTVFFKYSPMWYKNVTYSDEYRRGFDCREDLLVPGFFELPLEKGESIVFSASTSAVNPAGLKAQFTREVKRRMPLREAAVISALTP